MDPIPVFLHRKTLSLSLKVRLGFVLLRKVVFFSSFCFALFGFGSVSSRRLFLRKGKILDLIRNGDFRFDSFLCFLRFSRLRSHWPLSENGRPSDWRKNEFEERNIGYESSLKKFLRSD